MFHSTNVLAQEETQLIINGNMTRELSELNNRTIILKDNAYLTIKNVYFEYIFNRSLHTFEINLYDNANLEIINSTLPAGISLYNSSSVAIVNSTVFHASWCRVHNSYHNGSGIFVHDHSTFNTMNSKIGYIRSKGRNSGTVQGGSVMEIWTSSQESDMELLVDVKNCSVNRVHLNQPNIQVSSIRNGYHDELVIDHKLGTVIHLQESDLVDGLSLTYRDSPIEIDNSDIFVLVSHGCPRVEVFDSYIWDIVLWDSENVELGNCTVDYFTSINDNIVEINLNRTNIGRFDGHVSHFYRLNAIKSRIKEFYQGRNAEMSLYGMEIDFLDGDMEYLSMSGVFNIENNSLPVLISGTFDKPNITIDRVFPVYVQQLNQPIEGVLVEVSDENEVVFITRTDDEGLAKVQLLFVDKIWIEDQKVKMDSNLTQVYKLRVSDSNGFEYVQNLGVYSESPISVEYEDRVDEALLFIISVLCIVSMLVILRKALK